MSHDEASELLAVAALHAVDAETLAADRRARRDVSALPERARRLPRRGRGARQLRRGVARGTVDQHLESTLGTKGRRARRCRRSSSATRPADVVAIGTARRSRRRPRGGRARSPSPPPRRSWCSRSASRARRTTSPTCRRALKLASRSAVQRAMATPGHQVVDLTSATDQAARQVRDAARWHGLPREVDHARRWRRTRPINSGAS